MLRPHVSDLLVTPHLSTAPATRLAKPVTYLDSLGRTRNAVSPGAPTRPKQNAAKPEETLVVRLIIETTQTVPPKPIRSGTG